MLECVVNISEGRNSEVLQQLVAVCADDLLDVHVDPDHNRSVFTLLDVDAPRRLARQAVELLHLDANQGVHPRLGVVDVVPFVPLEGSTIDDAIVARDAFANWVSSELYWCRVFSTAPNERCLIFVAMLGLFCNRSAVRVSPT